MSHRLESRLENQPLMTVLVTIKLTLQIGPQPKT